MNFIVFVNYFLIGDIIPLWEIESIECLKRSTNRAISVGMSICVIVRVSDSDYNYFLEYFSDMPYIYVEKLPQTSLNRKLPFLSDILSKTRRSTELIESIFNGQSGRTYCVYKNADICLPDYFFEFISAQIAYQLRQTDKTGNDCRCSNISFIINRKDIIETSSSSRILTGDCKIRNHPGYDMFVFEDSMRKEFCLEEVAVGHPPVGAIMAINLLSLSDKVELINNLLITWHRGADQSWKQCRHSAEAIRNRNEGMKALQKLFKNRQDIGKVLKKTFGFERRWIINYLSTEYATDLNTPI